MTVRVDELVTHDPAMIKDARVRRASPSGRWCHLNADAEEELHAFAARLGLKRDWYQPGRRLGPDGTVAFDPYLSHYDIVPSKRALALQMGAVFEPIRDQARRAVLRWRESEAVDPAVAHVERALSMASGGEVSP
jgi:hypothetical protein